MSVMQDLKAIPNEEFKIEFWFISPSKGLWWPLVKWEYNANPFSASQAPASSGSCSPPESSPLTPSLLLAPLVIQDFLQLLEFVKPVPASDLVSLPQMLFFHTCNSSFPTHSSLCSKSLYLKEASASFHHPLLTYLGFRHNTYNSLKLSGLCQQHHLLLQHIVQKG